MCDFLDVELDPEMLDYGRHDHGPFIPGIGDFTAGIQADVVIPETMTVDPATEPEALRPTGRAWGYLPA